MSLERIDGIFRFMENPRSPEQHVTKKVIYKLQIHKYVSTINAL